MLTSCTRGFGLFAIAVAFAGPAPVWAQTHSASQIPSHITATAGAGTTLGGLGLQLQMDLVPQRLSAFAGAGFNPDAEDTLLGAAAGLRLFTAPAEHRGYLELGFAPIVLEEGRTLPGRILPRAVRDQYYGPSLALGLQRVFDSGFTVFTSYGVGYAIDVPDERSHVARAISVGFGFTWR